MRPRAGPRRAQTRWGDELRHQEAPQGCLPVMAQGPEGNLGTVGWWVERQTDTLLICVYGGLVWKGFLAERLPEKLPSVLKVGESSFFGWVEFSAGPDGGPRTRGV